MDIVAARAAGVAQPVGERAGHRTSRGRAHSAAVDRAERAIAAIDAAVSRQVDAIMHAPAFQALEATWRGLRLLLGVAGQTRQVRLRLLDLTWAELCRDIERAPETDQSHLFRLIYNEEIGTPGGQPLGLIVSAFTACHRPLPDHPTDDITALTGLATMAAAAFCPIVLGAHPALLGLGGWRDLAGVDVADALDGNDFIRWRALRQKEDTRFLGLALPRILLRPAFAPNVRTRNDGFCYAEDIGAEGEGLLWGSAAFAFAIAVIRRFDQSGWFADLRGAPQDEVGGGLVTELPPYTFATDAHGIAAQPPLEVRLSGEQEQQLADLGLLPVVSAPYSTALLFNTNASLHSPPRYDRVGATWNARTSSMLQYVLCVSRFAHFLMVIVRDRVGSHVGASDVQGQLNTWLARYCLGSDGATDEMRARFPLRDASAAVREIPGRPGALACTVHLQPHFQLDSIATSFRLLTDVTGR